MATKQARKPTGGSSGVQFITSPKGDEMAVMPRALYENLMEHFEDVVDARAAKEILRRIKSGEEETYPADMVKRLIDGKESRVRIWRGYRRMTAEKLAAAAGISRAYLTQIETGARIGPTNIMRRLAAALGCDLESLLPAAPAGNKRKAG